MILTSIFKIVTILIIIQKKLIYKINSLQIVILNCILLIKLKKNNIFMPEYINNIIIIKIG